jgi:drug/metabolite transporter (DMT)-like permease
VSITHQTSKPFGLPEWGLTGLIALIWGASFLFIRLGLETFGAGLVPPLRIAFGIAALACLGGFRGRIDRADWSKVALLGLLWMALPFLLFSLAERTVATSVTGMINGAVPLSSAAVFAIWHRRMPSVRRGVALLLGFAGVSIVAFAAASGDRREADVPGIVMLLAAIACYGVSANLTGPLQRRYGALTLIVRAQLVALVLSLPFGLWSLPEARFSGVGLGAMVLLGAFGTGFAYAILALLVGRTDATRGTVGVFLTPIVAVLLGATVRHEALSWPTLAGAGLVLIGAVLTSRPEPAS